MTATLQKISRRSLTQCVLVLSVSILLIGLLHEFKPQIAALAWHAKHGRNARFGSYVIPSSTWWPGLYSDDGKALSFWFYDGRREAGMMWFSIAPNSVSGAEFRSARVKADQKLGRVTDFFEAKIADSLYVCFDVGAVQASQTVDILCIPENEKKGLTSSFKGDRALKVEFLDTLQRIKKSN